MAGPGLVTLASLRYQAQERSDQLNSSFLSTSEWNRNIQGSLKELIDLIVAAYAEDYYATNPLQFPTNGQTNNLQGSFYPLPDGKTTFTDGITGATVTPPAFYKLLGVDLQLSAGNPGSYVSIYGFNFSDRNRYAVPNFQSFYGVTNLRARLFGNQLWLTPIPAGGQIIQLWQIPRFFDIQPEVIGGLTASSATVTCTDTSLLTVGMQLQYPPSPTGTIPAGTTILTITPNVSFTISSPATQTIPQALLRCWNDAVTIDGINGWEEYAVVDSALKAYGKEEDAPQQLVQSKLAMTKRLEDMAANRNAAWPATVVDKQWSDFGMPTGGGSGGFY